MIEVQMEKLKIPTRLMSVVLLLSVALCSCSALNIKDYREADFSAYAVLTGGELEMKARIYADVPEG